MIDEGYDFYGCLECPRKFFIYTISMYDMIAPGKEALLEVIEKKR